VLLATLVSTVTRRPHWTVAGDDSQQWSSVWRTPLAFLILWGILSLLVLPIRLTMVGSGELMEQLGGSGGLRAGIGALPWSFLLFAVWGGVIEVLSRTLGPRLVMSLPALAKLLAGRAIHPYWGQTLGMDEPRGALVHPDIAAEAAARAQAAPPVHGSAAPGAHPGAPVAHPGPAGAAAVHGSAPVYGSPPPPPGHRPPQGSGAAAAAAHGQPPQGHGQPPLGHRQAPMVHDQPPAGRSAPVEPFDKRKATIVGVVAGALVVA